MDLPTSPTVDQLISRATHALDNASHTNEPPERAYFLERARIFASLAQAQATEDLATETSRLAHKR